MRCIIITVVILSILLAGCDGEGIPGVTPAKVPPNYNPYQGAVGLLMSYRTGSPPAEVNSGKPFRIIVEISNEGAFDIAGGKIWLSNLIPEDLAITGSNVQTYDLAGRSKYIILGQKKNVVWDLTAQSMTETRSTQIGVVTEYTYRTTAEKTICIDPDIYSEQKVQKPCVMEKDITLTDQGAPMAVQEIRIEPVNNNDNSGEIYFDIVVRNLDTGTVSEADKINFVQAQVEFGSMPLTCETNEVQILDGEGTIRCKGTYDLPTARNYIMRVILDYKYQQKLDLQTIKIKKTRSL
jgi:hypothetical protein